MSEPVRIADQLRRAYAGPSWHGPALAEILTGVTPDAAARKAASGIHTIWEIVAHITVWILVCARRVEGEAIPVIPPEEDWPAVGDFSGAAWKLALDALAEAEKRLEALVRGLPESRLVDTVMGERPYSLYEMLHGVAQHNLYHAGQIALLKKLG